MKGFQLLTPRQRQDAADILARAGLLMIETTHCWLGLTEPMVLAQLTTGVQVIVSLSS
jgi:hypothetical protein